jgi:thiol-disulfide isomerase/thioredoxin
MAGLPFAFSADLAKSEKPQRIAFGQKIKIEDYLVPGKTTVVDFTSRFCPPCQSIAPHLDRLHEKRADIVVVAVDINRPNVKGIDWQSPVARQFDLNSIPHFRVYGPDGKLLAEGDKAQEMVVGWFEK